MKWKSAPVGRLTDEEYRKWYQRMSESRRARVDRLAREEIRKRSVMGEILARQAASEETGIPPEEILVLSAPDGRPYAEEPPVFLSITHTAELAAAAADTRPVGIDAEKIRPVKLLPAKRAFTAEEQRFLFGFDPADEDFGRIPDDETLQRFFFLWTRYEAWVKRFGDGIGKPAEGKDPALLETFCRDGYMISVARSPGDPESVPRIPG